MKGVAILLTVSAAALLVGTAFLPAAGAGDRPADAAASRPAGAARGPLRVLFLGNSYTANNRMPLMLGGLALASRPPQKITVTSVTPGGQSLRGHWGAIQRVKPPAKSPIASGRWDYVVLQDQSMMPLVRPGETIKYAGLLAEAAREAGATPVMYLTWARRNRPQTQTGLTRTYRRAAVEARALLAPVGLAWAAALEAEATLVLHRGDNSHPTVEGSYLAACVFYATLTGRNPVGLPGRLRARLKNGRTAPLATLPAERARFLQTVAWQTVRDLQAGLAVSEAPTTRKASPSDP